MKLLFSSDWQADFSNLDLCERAAEEILQLCHRNHAEVIVLCGDLKHVYNPVDVRVINFWIATISKWRKNGLEVVVLLGNHDRVGMHVDTQNWFPVLRKAGAAAYDAPGFHDCGSSVRLGMLPYRKDIGVLKADARRLASSAKRHSDLLVFHADLATAQYSVVASSEAGGEKLHVADLHPEKYAHCIGGHLHLQQKLEKNVWYVGSPFATDWGEANQKKGYLLFDSTNHKLVSVRSGIPGWYDPAWPQFSAPESWEGTRVRIKVPCSGVAHIQEELNRAKAEAARVYSGAEVVLVPALQEEARAVSEIRMDHSDRKKIEIYVKETLPEELKAQKEKIVSYLVEQLSQTGGLVREGGELKFQAVQGENFLSFRNLKSVFAPGLCVVSGENKDWQGRSNGAGKSSFLQPVAVGLFGQTFKNQKHDAWMRRGTERGKKAYVKVWFKDTQGRMCSVLRARKPKQLILTVDKKVLESGNRMEDTQKLIEQVSGYTWETLSNAIYVDQHAAHLMLTGTEAERKSFLAKLQNLERFERAEKEIRAQVANAEGSYRAIEAEITNAQGERNVLEHTAQDAQNTFKTAMDAPKQYKQAMTAFMKKKEELDEWEAWAAKKRQILTANLLKLRSEEEGLTKSYGRHDGELIVVERQMTAIEKIGSSCPTCQQPVSVVHRHKCLRDLLVSKNSLVLQKQGLKEELHGVRASIEELDKQMSKLVRNQPLAAAVQDLRDELSVKKQQWLQYKKDEEFRQHLRKKMDAIDARIARHIQHKKTALTRMSILTYAQSVFQRNGLPAYLNSQLCPQLNQAAEEYAELFAGGEIQVRFAVDEEGRMDVKVINTHGGEEVQDQSEGELKMASLITSFAFRSVAPKTNILILDEPGDGLDATSARAFARGLKKVVKRFGTVILTSHNPSILSELSDVKSIKITKKNGISEAA